MSIDTKTLGKMARERLICYSSFVDPKFTVDPIHRFMAYKLEQCFQRKIRRLIINVHPRLGKSRIATLEFPAWALGHDPTLGFMPLSYSGDLSKDHSRLCRNRMLNPHHALAFPNTRLSSTKVSGWTVEGGGHYIPAGIGGTITGRGADFIIVDDPHKNFEEAHSQRQRDKVWNFFLSDALSRLAPRGVIIVIATRWHPDDLTGRLLDPKRQAELKSSGAVTLPWEHINFTAIAEKDEQVEWFKRSAGESLSPSRWSAEEVKQKMAEVGNFVAETSWNGRPRTLGGGFISTHRFRIIEPDQVPQAARSGRWGRYWDTATTEKALSDYTAGIEGTIHDGNLYLRAMVRGQWLWPKARETICTVARSQPSLMVGIESAAQGTGLYQNLREHFPTNVLLRDYTPDKDKVTRASSWAALADNGKVFLIRDGGWIPAFIGECSEFPGGVHDDQVDAVSGLYHMLTQPIPRVEHGKLKG